MDTERVAGEPVAGEGSATGQGAAPAVDKRFVPGQGLAPAPGQARTAAPAALRRDRGGPFVPWSGETVGGLVPAAVLDAPMVPLVVALNASSWARTVFSCGGHPDEPDAITRQRRQAHVDVLVTDLSRWQVLAQRCRQHAPAAVTALGLGIARLRVVDGSLGPVPPWLVESMVDTGLLARESAIAYARDWGKLTWWRRLLGRSVAGPEVAPALAPAIGAAGAATGSAAAHSGAVRSGAVRWRYQRIVFEPVPYRMPAEHCRRVLDTAIAVAVGLVSPSGPVQR